MPEFIADITPHREVLMGSGALRGETFDLVAPVTEPIAPAPAATFRVIDAESAATLQRVEAEYPESHVLLGVLNMEAGIRDAAMRHFGQVPPTDPYAAVAQRSRERLVALGAVGQTR